MFTLDAVQRSKLARALHRLAEPERRWVSFQFLSSNEVACLAALANSQAFRRAKSEVSNKQGRVFQDFEVCFPAPRVDVFDRFASALEIGLYEAGQKLKTPPFASPFSFNDFAIQRYAPGSGGIGIHRDAKRYEQIVVIVNLAGRSRLFATNDRSGSHRRAINDQPGRIVLLSATGFAGRKNDNARPLHGVDHVHKGRLSLGFRVDAK